MAPIKTIHGWPLPPPGPAHIDCRAMAARFQIVRRDLRPSRERPARRGVARRAGRRGLDGFVVPHADRHQNEYVPPREERLAWLTGFTGSAGAAIVLADRAALFVDGRYTLQARDQVDTGAVLDRAPRRQRRPTSGSRRTCRPARSSATTPGCTPPRAPSGSPRPARRPARRWSPAEPNPIDAIWPDRPAPPLGARGAARRSNLPAKPAAAQARAHARRDRQAQGRRARSSPIRTHVAWTFNIRGSDVAHTPLRARLRARAARGPARALCRRAQASQRGARRISRRSPTCASPPRSRTTSKALGAAQATVRLDSATAADAIAPHHRASGGKSRAAPIRSPLMKAIKNDTEIAGTRAAHRRDGAAVTRFLAWFDREAPVGQAHRDRRGRGAGDVPPRHRPPQGRVVPDHLGLRAERRDRALPRHARDQPPISPGEMFLVDSGAQYEDGTTDITRTVVVGEPTRGDARPLHPRAQGPHRDRARGVSRGHHGRAARQLRARSRCGPPASISTTAPATASAAISRCTRARRASPSSAPRRSSAA